MITSNGCVVWMLLSASVCILTFQWWRNSVLANQLRIANAVIDREEFSIVSNIIEQERSRISSELHDELGTLLSIIYLDLELVTHEASSLTPYAENRLIEIKRNLNLVIESIRTNIWNLSGQTFDQVDLAFVVRELCHKLDRYKGTHVAFVQSGLPFSLNEKYKLNVFRITQELLTNAIKHSSAWNISIHIHWYGKDHLLITIEDDGVSYTEQKKSHGIGILNINKRADYIGAKIFRERLKKGHRVILTLKIA
jgi:signal transduction histidine kinase